MGMTMIERLWDKVKTKVIEVIDKAWHLAADEREQWAHGVVLLFSAGKDSSLILAALFDPNGPNIVHNMIDTAHLSEFYVTHIVIPGNSHPANTYCAASIMLAARDADADNELLSANPVMLAQGAVFQAYAAKYGLVIGPRRWCFLVFKHQVLYNWLKRQFPRGHVIVVDGMSPDDRPQRRHAIKDAVEEVETSDGYRFVAAHPLYDLDLDAGEKLELLKWLARRGEEGVRSLHDPILWDYHAARVLANLRCVVELYETYGDSMNCVLCPYKTPRKLLRNVSSDPALRTAVAQFIEVALRGEHWQRYAKLLQTKPLTDYIECNSIGER